MIRRSKNRRAKVVCDVLGCKRSQCRTAIESIGPSAANTLMRDNAEELTGMAHQRISKLCADLARGSKYRFARSGFASFPLRLNHLGIIGGK
jgi:hypothetical protein